jgi:hypothetical protein
MALTTYDELKTAIEGLVLYSAGSAAFTTADTITLCEADLRRRLRHHKMLTRSTSIIDSRTIAVPTDWLETRRLALISPTTSARTLQMASVDELMDRRIQWADQSGTPELYAHVGEEFEVWPQPDAEYTAEILYYADFESLSALVSTNWILEQAPDVYLYGSLVMAETINRSDERVPLWAQMYESALTNLNGASERAKVSGSSLRMRWR